MNRRVRLGPRPLSRSRSRSRFHSRAIFRVLDDEGDGDGDGDDWPVIASTSARSLVRAIEAGKPRGVGGSSPGAITGSGGRRAPSA